MADDMILEVTGLSQEYPIYSGLLRRRRGTVKAVQDVSFELGRRESLGIVGESGCGKTSLARSLIRLIEPSRGKVILRVNGSDIDLLSLSPKQMQRCRRHVQMVFQDPVASLNPRVPVLEVVGEPLIVNGVCRGRELTSRVAELLEMVGLAAVDMHRFPHAFSGGQRQRIGIARALALQPEMIIADEPVSALDVSVQAQILNLLVELQERLGLSLIFIGHDLSIIRQVCDRVAVMYLGRIVEIGETGTVFERPSHPYTEVLLSAVPVPDPKAQRGRQRIHLSGEPPSPVDPPSGCPFHPRCRYAIPECSNRLPDLSAAPSGARAACIRKQEIDLTGVSD